MTEGQAAQMVAQSGGTFISKRQGIEWWKLMNGNWLAVKKDNRGNAEVRQVPADRCNCG